MNWQGESNIQGRTQPLFVLFTLLHALCSIPFQFQVVICSIESQKQFHDPPKRINLSLTNQVDLSSPHSNSFKRKSSEHTCLLISSFVALGE